MPSHRVTGVLLSLLLDDADPSAARGEVREKVLDVLDEPLDAVEATEWRRGKWGVEGASARAAEATERAAAGSAGDFADVDLDELRARRDAKAGQVTP